MIDRPALVSRRSVLTGLAGAIPASAMARPARAQGGRETVLRASPKTIGLLAGQSETAIWDLEASAPLRFKRGAEMQFTFANDLPVPAVLNWHGVNGAASAEALAAQPPLGPGAQTKFSVALRHAGTFLCDSRLLGDGQARAAAAQILIVEETQPPAVDRDEVMLIEDWRISRDGVAIAPGVDPKDTTPLFTINRKPSLDVIVPGNARLRLRFVNGCQRAIIAIKIEDHDVRVMAIDGQPSEPFPARDGQFILAPGSRLDAFVDATRPPGSASAILLHDGTAPRPIARLVISQEPAIRKSDALSLPLASNGLPARLDLQGAMRVEVPLTAESGGAAGWLTPVNLNGKVAPAFRVKRGRTVVLALVNRAATPMVFHLHGHHFRLLDRLDDGWKPYWLDTLAVDAGQTQRIAFAAEFAGNWLLEAIAPVWSAPRLVRWYAVE